MTNRRPSVLFIISDDTPKRFLSPYGGLVRMPHLERLAREGMTCHGAHCPSAICQPSRYSYITGRYAARCDDPVFLYQSPYDEVCNVQWNAIVHAGTPTVFRSLSAQGYRTGFSGKCHTGHEERILPVPRFAVDDDPADPAVGRRLKEHQAVLQEVLKRTHGCDWAGGVTWDNNDQSQLAALRHHHCEYSVAAADVFIRSTPVDQPFFLHYASTCLHGPNIEDTCRQDPRITPEGWKEDHLGVVPPRSGLRQRVLDLGIAGESLHEPMSMLHLDDQIGALLKALDDTGRAEDTIVIYCSDHGVEPAKASCYEIGVHVPLIIRAPGRLAPGSENHGRFQNLDVMPTILGWCGAALPGGLDGRDLAPLLAGATTQVRSHEFFEMGYTRAVRSDRFTYLAFRYPERVTRKLLADPQAEAPNHIDIRMQQQARILMHHYPHYWQPDQLYDRQADPEERVNLAADPAYAEVLAEHQRILAGHLATFPHPFPLEDRRAFESPHWPAQRDRTMAIGTRDITWWPKSRWGVEGRYNA